MHLPKTQIKFLPKSFSAFIPTVTFLLPGGKGNSSDGQSKFVSVLAKAAVTTAISGIFMETHENPVNAPSDGPNMVPLKKLGKLIHSIKLYDNLSKNELELIQSEAPAKTSASSIPFLKLIQNKPFMAITVATFCNNWSLYTFLSYLPKYVNAPVSQGGMGIDLGSIAFIYSIVIPCLVAMIALILGGFLADYLIKKGYEVIKVRKTVNSIGFFGSAFFLYLISFEDSLLNAVILLCLINICSGICAGGFGVNHADLGPKYTGSLVGIAGSIGMIAAILAPIVAGFILEITNSWSSIFYICSFVLIFGGIFYLIFASASRQFN